MDIHSNPHTHTINHLDIIKPEWKTPNLSNSFPAFASPDTIYMTFISIPNSRALKFIYKYIDRHNKKNNQIVPIARNRIKKNTMNQPNE